MNQIFEHFGLAAQLAEETSRKNQSDVYVTKSFVGGLRYIATTTPKETDKLLNHYQLGKSVPLGTDPLPKPKVFSSFQELSAVKDKIADTPPPPPIKEPELKKEEIKDVKISELPEFAKTDNDVLIPEKQLEQLAKSTKPAPKNSPKSKEK